MEPKTETAAPPPANPLKKAFGLLFTVVLIATLVAWLHSGAAAKLRNDRTFEPFIHRHVILAPLAYVGVYLFLAVMALPVWPLQVLAGIGFGLYEGTFLSLIASTIGSVITVAISRWFASEWFHERIESRVEKLKALDETLGHNGFLVVMTVRLIHLLPFGICNYALGLTLVSYMDVVLGTFLGGIPAVSTYVGIGAHYHPWTNWKFAAVITTINVILLLPLILRYLKPQWFKKIGVE